MLKRIGVEPSGDAFNSTHLLRSERPFNAMLNAGAIAVTSMVPGKTGDEKFERILDLMSKAAGRQLEVDERVYKSELATGDRNRAIAYLLRGVNVVEQDIEDLLQTYFRQCAIRVTCRDLAIMGATLGNIGINPITGKDVLDLSAVRDVLTVMFTCGMYDFAGEWALKVGVPAKSGVSGGIMAVVNRQLGMGIYSPRLDPMGNSIRGVNLCSKFAEEQGLHLFNFSNVGSTFLEAISKPNTSSD
ncbi:MAG: glutaminase A [Pirellulaceae bacterium]|nr:glutaminase A [Pirellulaceae bacterium]